MKYYVNNLGHCKMQVAALMLIVLYFAFLPFIIRDTVGKQPNLDRANGSVTNATNTTIDCDALINVAGNESGGVQIILRRNNSRPNETEGCSLSRNWPDPEHAVKHRSKRQQEQYNLDDSWMDHPNPPHPYATNMWWRLLNHTVRMYASRNCYVCAQFAHSTTGGDWWPHQDKSASEAAMVAVAAAGLSGNMTTEARMGKVGGTWAQIALTRRLFGQVATVKHIPVNLTCYERKNGTKKVGRLPRQRCTTIYKPVRNYVKRNCMTCLRGDNGPSHFNESAISQPVINQRYLAKSNSDQAKCPNCSRLHVPDQEGTGVVEGYYWLCGYRVYLSLPQNWTGLCALIQLHGGAIILPHGNKAIILADNKRRQRRGLFDFATESPVPKNHHIWTIAEKLLGVFAPSLGVASTIHQVEITRYELTSFINTTKIMMGGIQEELRGIRLTALQNRLVLDQLTAAQGGVCAMVGETCCTYIPDNDADGHLIEQGIQNITQLTKLVTAEDQESDGFNLDWLSFEKLCTILMWVVCTLILIVSLMYCWPCVQQAIKQVTPSVIPGQMVIYSVNVDENRICENM